MKTPERSVNKSKYAVEFTDAFKGRKMNPTVTIFEAFDAGFEKGLKKGMEVRNGRN
jgi:hypothetical protein